MKRSLLALVVALLLAGGCGSDDDEAAQPERPEGTTTSVAETPEAAETPEDEGTTTEPPAVKFENVASDTSALEARIGAVETRLANLEATLAPLIAGEPSALRDLLDDVARLNREIDKRRMLGVGIGSRIDRIVECLQKVASGGDTSTGCDSNSLRKGD